MKASEMYSRTIENLRRSIEQHQVADGRASVKAFAESYGYDRSNLVHILGQRQDISVGLFLRLAWSLKKKGPAPIWLGEGLNTISLCTWLGIDGHQVHQAMYEVNFAG